MLPAAARFDYLSMDPHQLALGPRRHHPPEWTHAFGSKLCQVSPQAVRLEIDNPIVRLQAVAARLSHGLTVSYGQADVVEAWNSTRRMHGQLSICCIGSGQVLHGAAGGGRFAAGQCAVVLLPAGTDMPTHVPGGQQLASVRLAVDPESLARDFGLAGGAERLRQAVGGLMVFELDAVMRRLQNEILALQLDRPGAGFRLEAASLQLLVAALDRVLDRPAQPAPDPLLLRPREESRLHSARQLLGLRFDRPPTVSELARQVGTNPCKLNRGFKLLFGETVGECTMRLRMEHALRLLVDERLSVSEVSYKVGYQHHSSFTAAFSTHFGASPTAMVAAAHAKVH